MKETFLRIERFTSGVALAGACLMLVIASALAMFQIITRFVLEQPAEWTEILIRLSLIWMVSQPHQRMTRTRAGEARATAPSSTRRPRGRTTR